jgi:4-amino-4-deoxy-L-arabinose transferase-like glycosyltransferase/tetratricopeptide (TPR) repeat protein
MRLHWPVAVLAGVAAFLLLTNLGRDYLWEDEGDTAVLARNILREGLPVAWDGTTFTAPDFGQRLKFGFVMVSHPWLQYYVVAASFRLLGESPWAARLPFALAGLATIVLVYGIAASLLRNRAAAISAATLLTVSVQFLLFSRQARNYSFNALLTCLLVWQFHRLSSKWNAALFALIAILLFHAHAIGLAAVGALGLLTLLYPPFSRCRRWFWPAALGVALYAAPWLAVSREGYTQNTMPLDVISRFVPRLLQFVIECASVTPLVGVLALGVILHRQHRRPLPRREWRGRRRRDGLLMVEERRLVVACAAIAVAEAVAVAVTHSRDMIWVVGLHHTPALIPLVAMVAGLLIVKVSGSRRTVWLALMLVFALTRFANAAPWTFWAETTPVRDPDGFLTFHVPATLKDRMLRTTQVLYVKSLFRPNPGVITRVTEFLRANAGPRDVVITNYEWEALYFHTGLPQGAKIDRSFPIYSVARARQLPDYVFSAAGVRWIVWRRAWAVPFPAQDCGRILRQLERAGMTPELVRSIPETLYENRENVHFHRFAGNSYAFRSYQDLPAVEIYRVDWHSHQPADALFEQQKFGEAIVEYRAYLKHRPDDIAALTNLGIALVAIGRTEEAIPTFRHVIDVAPDNGDARRNLANALLERGEINEAALQAERAVALQSSDPGAHDVLGLTLTVRGKLTEAALEFERALQADPTDAETREHLRRVRRLMRQR